MIVLFTSFPVICFSFFLGKRRIAMDVELIVSFDLVVWDRVVHREEV